MIDVKNHVFDVVLLTAICPISFFIRSYFIYSLVPYEIAQYLLNTNVYLSFQTNTYTANVFPIKSAGNPCVAKCSLYMHVIVMGNTCTYV